MTSTYTQNLSLQLQGTNDNTGTWGATLNTNVITLVDNALGGTYAANVAGNSDVTLSVPNSGYLIHNLTGVLTGNISYIFPQSTGSQNVGRFLVIKNATTGSFTITVKPIGGTGVTVTQGTTQLLYIDSSNTTAYVPINTTNLGALAAANNLSDIASASSSRTNLGLGSTITGSGNTPLATGPTLNQPNIVGTTTNDSASAGSVGEYTSASVAAGSAISCTSGVTANITSISLTAGDWDVWGNVFLVPSGGTVTAAWTGAINTTSATLPTTPAGGGAIIYGSNSITGQVTSVFVMSRLSIAITTTVYLVANASFGGSASLYGSIQARRRR